MQRGEKTSTEEESSPIPQSLGAEKVEWTSQDMLESCDVFPQNPQLAQSMTIPRQLNGILRIPDGKLVMEKQAQFHEMLLDVYKDPKGFQKHVQDRRQHMNFPANKSPIDRPGTLSTSDFKQLKAIGSGHFSNVYYCRDVQNNQEYALKQIKITQPSSKACKPGESNTYGKCLKEVGLLQTLSHPHIIQCYSTFFEDSYMYIVLEWAGGGDLQMLISAAKARNITFPEDLIWQYLEQVGSAIQYMHAQRIMHRDLKPSNILLTSGGELKVADFGLGRYLNFQSVMAYTQVGTPLYMSPEILKGQGHTFGSDIWSLGCVVYELATGNSPFFEPKLAVNKLFWKISNGYYQSLQQSQHYKAALGQLTNMMLDIDHISRININEVMQFLEKMKYDGDVEPSSDFEDTIDYPAATSLNEASTTEEYTYNGGTEDEYTLDVEEYCEGEAKLEMSMDQDNSTQSQSHGQDAGLFERTNRAPSDRNSAIDQGSTLNQGAAMDECHQNQNMNEMQLESMESEISSMLGSKSSTLSRSALKLSSPLQWIRNKRKSQRVAVDPNT
mmetsp:Transcript_30975/g.40901  ORF Transcript_30975/g.40901 Transcript_30975/m.40901 type:complete len:555 (+) Transcript_30975:111-1775(+)|eukprot:CAMPEP_0117746346 /NCGR_PEP_ID=MMETSP0947-20121206/7892_1 /TAXON_ID=44440 /ORGANISM="Chattonella subsalsa, Strain CCMP2191" /LENGTH=554 /DNA_ID=CAMNT_0005563653 /DNA_START=92 /DNA_END=1756 /DNA_ORIENTATION=+